MGELLMLFITGGGSTAMGAILKGVLWDVYFEAAGKTSMILKRVGERLQDSLAKQDNFLLDYKLNSLKAGTGGVCFFYSSYSCCYRGVYALITNLYHPLHPLPLAAEIVTDYMIHQKVFADGEWYICFNEVLLASDSSALYLCYF